MEGQSEGESEPGPEASVDLTGRSARRLTRLMEEFLRRQRQRPDLVVRPWWTAQAGAAAVADAADASYPAAAPGASAGAEGAAGSEGARGREVSGFVVEYCPRGVESAELAVRADRARVEARGGLEEVRLDLEAGWYMDGVDRHCRETLVNHLLSLADGLL